MWWKKTHKPSLREQLVAARAKVERQLAIMSTGLIRGYGAPTGAGGYQPGLREELESELREINEALTNLGPDDA